MQVLQDLAYPRPHEEEIYLLSRQRPIRKFLLALNIFQSLFFPEGAVPSALILQTKKPRSPRNGPINARHAGQKQYGGIAG